MTDEFMRAVEDGGDFALRARTDGRVIETVNARELFDKMAKAVGSAPIPAFSTTTPSTTGTPIPRRAGSPHPIPAVST